MNKLELAQGLCNAQSTDPNADPVRLVELRKIPKGTFKASDEDWYVRYNVALNPSTPSEALIKLTSDTYWEIRYYVAHNPSTSPKVLIKLACDNDWNVRCGVAQNPSTSREALEILLLDPEIHNEVINVLLERNKKSGQA